MPAARKFEDLLVWAKARRLAAAIDEQCTTPPLSRNFALADQMRRSSISVTSNIAEGFELGAPRQFRHYLRIAKASLAELRSQLYLCGDRGYIDQQLCDSLQQQAEEIARMLRSLIRHLETARPDIGNR